MHSYRRGALWASARAAAGHWSQYDKRPDPKRKQNTRQNSHVSYSFTHRTAFIPICLVFLGSLDRTTATAKTTPENNDLIG